MVKQRVMFFVLLLFSLTASIISAAELNVVVDKTAVEIGKYLSVRLIYTGESVPGSSNLKQWYEDFFVELRDTEAENLPDGLIQYTEFLRLHPRVVGDKVLTSIALGGAVSAPLKIEVKPLVRNKINGTPLWFINKGLLQAEPSPTGQLLTESIWQGETIQVSIRQNLLHASNEVIVEDDLPSDFFPGFFIQKTEMIEIKRADSTQINSHKIIQLNWLLSAQSPGVFQLDPPAIVQRGRGRWRFYFPRIEVRVKPLPSYIPPTIPVGKVFLQTGLIYEKNKPFWFIEVMNKGALPEEIYGIRSQLMRLSGLKAESVKHSNRVLDQTTENFTSIQHYQFPVPQWTMGVSAGLHIEVSYFDAADGKIKKVSQRLPAVWNIPDAWSYVFIVLGTLMLVSLLWLSFKRLKNFLAWRQYLLQLQQKTDPHDIRQLLLAQMECGTLEAWSQAQSPTHESDLFGKIARRLNTLCYARSSLLAQSSQTQVSDIQAELLKIHTFRYWLNFSRLK